MYFVARVVFLSVTLGCIFLNSCNCFSCNLPADYLNDTKLLPERVVDRFCYPDEGYESLLLIRAAVSEDSPVFRIVSAKRIGLQYPQEVRLYQFDRDGNDHPPVGGEVQNVIDFQGNSDHFEERVKKKKTTISFSDQNFKFQIHGLFGLTIEQPLDSDCRIIVNGTRASILLIRSPRKSNWEWVLENGEKVPF